MDDYAEIVRQISTVRESDDHEQGCDARSAACQCGYEQRVDAALVSGITAITTLLAERDMLEQTSMDLCEACGWAMKCGDGCYKCRVDAAETERDAALERERVLREALKPFAAVAEGEVYAKFVAENRSVFRLSNGSGAKHLTFINAECFDAALAALSASGKQEVCGG